MSRGPAAWLVIGPLAAVLVLAPGAEAADDARVAATITDERVTESSGLVQSLADPALAYTVNDSGNASVVFVVEVATGDVVGTATFGSVEMADAEAMTIGADGRLVVGDIGDNAASRRTVDLYALDQPGRGDVTVEPVRYRVRYDDGPKDAEALVSDVLDGSFHIVSKGLLGGDLYRLGALREDGVTPARRVEDVRMPGLATDADVLRGRGGAVVRTYGDAFVYAVPGWELLAAVDLPSQRQGETVMAVDGGPEVYAGTEGLPSTLVRSRVPPDAWRELGQRQEPTQQPTDGADDGGGEGADARPAAPGSTGEPERSWPLDLVVGAVAALLLVLLGIVARRRRDA